MAENSPFAHLSDEQLREELHKNGIECGPIIPTTRRVYEKKLQKMLKVKDKPAVPKAAISHGNETNASENGFNAKKSAEKPSIRKKGSPANPPVMQFEESFVNPSPQIARAPIEDYGDDDHMESFRFISPQSRFRPSSTGRPSAGFGNPNISQRSSLGFGSANVSQRSSIGFGSTNASHHSSPVEKLRNFGRTTWGYFSRPLGTSTPCSDANKYTISNKYRRYGSVADFDKGHADYSRWIGYGLVVFFGLIALCYVFQANTEAMYSVLRTGKDVALGLLDFIYPLFTVLLVVVLAFLIYKAVEFYRQRKANEKQRLIQLVERITDLICESGSAGIAEPHVRDMLMPPTKRTNTEYKLWQEAARFINNEDSRIRTEIRLIDGTECSVWIWIGAGKQRWQGTAVAEGSPLAKIPEHALTRCLKLRGVDFADNVVEKESIRKELLAKLKPVIPVHLGFVSYNLENVVYMMLRDFDDAKKAFTAFHSHWFNGNMITVKYVRDERYLERFPDAGYAR